MFSLANVRLAYTPDSRKVTFQHMEHKTRDALMFSH